MILISCIVQFMGWKHSVSQQAGEGSPVTEGVSKRFISESGLSPPTLSLDVLVTASPTTRRFFISFQQSIASPYWTNVLYIIWNCAWLSIDNDSHFIYSSIHGLKALYLTTNWWGVASDREDFEALHFLKSGFISAFAFTWCPWYGKPVQAVCRFFLYAFSIVLPY